MPTNHEAPVRPGETWTPLAHIRKKCGPSVLTGTSLTVGFPSTRGHETDNEGHV